MVCQLPPIRIGAARKPRMGTKGACYVGYHQGPRPYLLFLPTIQRVLTWQAVLPGPLDVECDEVCSHAVGWPVGEEAAGHLNGNVPVDGLRLLTDEPPQHVIHHGPVTAVQMEGRAERLGTKGRFKLISDIYPIYYDDMLDWYFRFEK